MVMLITIGKLGYPSKEDIPFKWAISSGFFFSNGWGMLVLWFSNRWGVLVLWRVTPSFLNLVPVFDLLFFLLVVNVSVFKFPGRRRFQGLEFQPKNKGIFPWTSWWVYQKGDERPCQKVSLLGSNRKNNIYIVTAPCTWSQLSHEKNPGWLGYLGDYTTQLYRHYNKPL